MKKNKNCKVNTQQAGNTQPKIHRSIDLESNLSRFYRDLGASKLAVVSAQTVKLLVAEGFCFLRNKNSNIEMAIGHRIVSMNNLDNNQAIAPKETANRIWELLTTGESGRGADLYQVNLSRRDLHGVNLHGATLIRANFTDADLSEANLGSADLRGASLVRAKLIGANLAGARLIRVALYGADLTDADLSDANLQGARYDRQTIFPEHFNYKSSGAIGPEARLNGAELNTANLRQIDLHGATLLGAYLGGADLTGANLAGARLTQADLRCAFLAGANLRYAGINGVNLAGADLRGADLTGVEFDKLESIAGADFSQVRGMTDELRSRLLAHPTAELETYNAFTRSTTGESLQLEN